jgi:hypothetical protein
MTGELSHGKVWSTSKTRPGEARHAASALRVSILCNVHLEHFEGRRTVVVVQACTVCFVVRVECLDGHVVQVIPSDLILTTERKNAEVPSLYEGGVNTSIQTVVMVRTWMTGPSPWRKCLLVNATECMIYLYETLFVDYLL